MKKILTDTLISISEILRKEHSWTTSDTGDPNVETTENDELIRLLQEHLWMFCSDDVIAFLLKAEAETMLIEAKALEMKANKMKELSDGVLNKILESV